MSWGLIFGLPTAGLEDDDFGQSADAALEFLRVALDGGEGAVVNRDDALGLDELHRLGRGGDAHRVAVPDRDKAQVGPEKFAHELHVVGQPRIPGMV